MQASGYYDKMNPATNLFWLDGAEQQSKRRGRMMQKA
jgi:hypothetical protein